MNTTARWGRLAVSALFAASLAAAPRIALAGTDAAQALDVVDVQADAVTADSGTADAIAPEAPCNGVPMMTIFVDESEQALADAKADDPNHAYGTYDEVMGSPDHSVRGIGSASIVVPEGYVSEYGSSSVPEGKLELDFFRGRGKSTWDVGSRHLPLKIKFADKQDFFGMGASKEWALLYSKFDSFQITNRLAYWLGPQVGMPYTPQIVPVDVTVVTVKDGQEVSRSLVGDFYLSELPGIGEGRVEIDKLKKNMTDDEEITGGYLISLYTHDQNPDVPERNVITTSHGMTFFTRSPEFEDEELTEGEAKQLDYISNYLNEVDELVMGEGLIDEERHNEIAELMDLRSAADYWWFQLFTRNQDAFKTSSNYLYKPRGGKLCWGPLWDFDVAWPATGGRFQDHYEGYKRRGWMTWLDTLRDKDPQFARLLRERWSDPVDGFEVKLKELTRPGGVLDAYHDETRESMSYVTDENIDGMRAWIDLRRAWVHDNQWVGVVGDGACWAQPEELDTIACPEGVSGVEQGTVVNCVNVNAERVSLGHIEDIATEQGDTWFALRDKFALDHDLEVTGGHVNLVLAEGATLDLGTHALRITGGELHVYSQGKNAKIKGCGERMVSVQDGGKLVLHGCLITAETKEASTSAVVVEHGGSLLQLGGNITGQRDDRATGVSVNGGAYELKGGSVTGCACGVALAGGSVAMSGGEVSGNFTGLAVDGEGVLSVAGGCIKDNHVGVQGAFALSGAPEFSNNSEADACLVSADDRIETGSLDKGVKVVVKLAGETSVFTRGFAEYNKDVSPADVFAARGGTVVALDQSGEAKATSQNDLKQADPYFLDSDGDAADTTGRIAYNVRVMVPGAIGVDVRDAMMRFAIGGDKARKVEVSIDDAKLTMGADGISCATFSLPISAGEMSEEITATFAYKRGDEEKSVEMRGSLGQQLQERANKGAGDKAGALAQAMLDYGTCAQRLFGGKTGDALSMDDVTIGEEHAAKVVAVSGGFDGKVKSITASLALESEAAINFYVKPQVGVDAGEIKVAVDGNETSPSVLADGRVLVTVSDIAAKDFNHRYRVRVTVGGESKTIEYSALSYAYSKSRQAGAVSDVAKALYKYWNAAKKIVG